MTSGARTIRIAMASFGVAGLGSAVAALFGAERLALAGLALLMTASGVLLLSLLARVSNLRKILDAGGRPGTSAEPGREEATERRILAVIEAERLRAADRHRELLRGSLHESGRKSADEVIDGIARVRSDLKRREHDESRSVEAALQLHARFSPRAPMPPSGKWAMDARGLLELVALVQSQDVTTVVELGGGTSTVWLAYALEQTGGRLVSIDHDSTYGEVTRWNIERHRLGEIADVRIAPLRPWDGEGTSPWYATDAFSGLSDIDLLLVDGPPASTAPDARYPALPVLLGQLSEGALVVLDDADRSTEKRIVERWLEEFPSLTRVGGDYGRMVVLKHSVRPV